MLIECHDCSLRDITPLSLACVHSVSCGCHSQRLLRLAKLINKSRIQDSSEQIKPSISLGCRQTGYMDRQFKTDSSLIKLADSFSPDHLSVAIEMSLATWLQFLL